MKKLAISIIGIILCVNALAQNPGYMGNHFIFSAEVSLSPSWTHPNPLTPCLSANVESAAARRYLGLNYFVTPNIEYIVWRKGSIGAGYNYYNSPFNGLVVQYFEYPNQPNSTYLQQYEFTGNIVAHGFNVFYKQYLGDTRAPLGCFAKFVFDGFFYKTTCNENVPHEMEYYAIAQKEGKGSLFGLKAEIGYDYVFFNRLRLSVGVSLGTTFGGYKAIPKLLDDGIEIDTALERNLRVSSYARNRILNAYWFGLKVGIGFIAF